MLIPALRRSVSQCTIGVRSYARGRQNVRAPSGGDAGVKRRTQAFQEAGVDIPPGANLDELLEESEADMQNMHLAFNKYLQESEEEKDKLRHRIVHRKYFTEQMPNFLTWSEKEQIRYLSSECGDEWTHERIAESFPVTPEVVKKLIRYPWKPSTAERIARHDHSAMRNWKELKEGNLDIPPELREHLLKFSDRTIPPLKESSIIPVITKEKIGEFQSIIEKCASKERQKAMLESQKENENKIVIKDDSLNEDTASKNPDTPVQKDLKRYTLDHLKLNIGRKMAAGKNVNDVEQYILSSSEPKDDNVTTVAASQNDKIVTKVKPEMMAFREEANKVAPVEIAKRIRIPKAAYKRGRTYRVNDCYYDYDGIFLYRVPGLSSVSGIKNNENN